MKFIDIEQRTSQGRGFSDEPHGSSLIIHDDGLQVLGIIPHGNLIRPRTAAQRDTWISHLQGLKYGRENILIHTGNPLDDPEGCGMSGPEGYCCTHHENGKHVARGYSRLFETWPIEGCA